MPTMPNVVGVNWQQATASLIQAGVAPDNGSLPSGAYPQLGYFDDWSVSLEWVKAGAVEPGIVTAQIPAPASVVALGAPVLLTVANFPLSVSNMFSAGGYS
jgi:beta-lactam-binding protein with PASTA domain